MSPSFSLLLAPVAVFLVASCTGRPPEGHAGWQIESKGSFTVKGTIIEDRDISGIASISPTQCLLGSDETRIVQTVAVNLAGAALTMQQTVELLPEGSQEIDIEGIAVSRANSCYYVTGSHSVSRKKGKYEAARSAVFRVPVDAATGQLKGKVTSASLRPILQTDAILSPYLDKIEQERGLNIEGLAEKGGRLFFGFRGPNLEGNAFVLETHAEGFFSSQKPAYTLHKVALGRGWGIRELTTTKDGFLITAGNSAAEPNDDFPKSADYDPKRGYAFYFWTGPGSAPVRIAELPVRQGKAEALLVLKEDDATIDVLLICDGPSGGAPTAYRLTKPVKK